MTLNDEDRELLINNYLDKSRTTIKKVEFLALSTKGTNIHEDF